MKTITKYVADDGSEHADPKSAIARDILKRRVALIMAPMGSIPEGVQRGDGWLQHDPETVLTARDGIVELCREMGYADHYPVFKHSGRDIHPCSVVGRILCDNGGPLYDAWSRFMNTDEQGREHQQGYFALNGPDSHHKEIKRP